MTLRTASVNLEYLIASEEELPELPEHLDSLLDLPYTKDASIAIDKWHNYIEIEWSTSDDP